MKTDKTHDDSNESFFHPKNLGRTNFASGWTTAGLFRYASVCTAICNNSIGVKPYKILDVGCSTATFFGFFVDSFVKKDKPDIDYLGLEIRDACIEKANEMFKERSDKYRNIFNCKKFNAITDNLPDEKFDCIILAEILEHIGTKSAKIILDEARMRLSENGIIVISSPNPRKAEGHNFVWPENHIYEFTLKEMVEICKSYNLSVKHIFGWLRHKHVDIPDNFKFLNDSLGTISPGIRDSIMAHIYPHLAECYTIILKKEM